MTDELPRHEELTPRECMILLGSVSLGRIVFTAQALPAVRLVSHLVDGNRVIVRADASAPITSNLASRDRLARVRPAANRRHDERRQGGRDRQPGRHQERA